MNIKTTVFLILVFLAFASHASAGIITVSADFTAENIGKKFEYFEDAEGSKEFKDIFNLAGKWIENDKDEITKGFTSSVYWFRFTVNNTFQEKQHLYFRISYAMLDSVVLYRNDNGSGYKSFAAGDLLPYHNREIDDVAFVFNLNCSPGKNTY